MKLFLLTIYKPLQQQKQQTTQSNLIWTYVSTDQMNDARRSEPDWDEDGD